MTSVMTPQRPPNFESTSDNSAQLDQSSGSGAFSVNTLIVGAGLGGLAVAISLESAGLHDFLIVEKSDGLGGTWRSNTYPGCACDVSSVMYSYSFASAHAWTRMYPQQAEILDYITQVADRYKVSSRIRYSTAAESYAFDEDCDRWTVQLSDGTEMFANHVVLAHGALNVPYTPNVSGSDKFLGEIVHTADWDERIDLTGKRVAVIGTGSSAVQLIPEIAKYTSHVDVFQRTAHWALPKPDRALSERERTLLKTLPVFRQIYRNVAYWSHEVPVIGFKHPRLMRILERASRKHMEKQISDPALRAKVTPDYTIGCKRILLTSDYYPALQKDNVNLITDEVVRFTPDGVVAADGSEYKCDVVVYATGFQTNNRSRDMAITGRAGLSLKKAWSTGAEAYLGMVVSGFPNMFHIMGPNSGGGSQSILFVIEAQARYITKCLRFMSERNFTRTEVRADVQRKFNDKLHANLAGTVWNSGGCTSWFLDEGGMNRQSWPGTGTSYWRAVRRPRFSAFEWSGDGRSAVRDEVPRSGSFGKLQAQSTVQ